MHAEIRQQTLYLSERVTMDVVDGQRYAEFCALVSKPVDCLDLSGVKEADSVCVALLIAALRLKKQQQVFHVVGIPDGVDTLLDLYDVSDWVRS